MLYKIKVIIGALYHQSRFFLLSILLLPAYIFYIFFRLHESIWLIGENAGRCLNDNGYIFYKFCRKNHPNTPVYLVTRKESINNDPFLKTDSNIIVFGSLKHIFFFLLSDTLIYSHAQSDIGYIQIIKLLKKNCTRVFLQHGIIAFKKVHSTYKRNHNEMDIFIVSSDFEKKIILDNFSFNENIVKITGLARYDELFEMPFPHQKSIIYMPTWRNWAFPKKNAKHYIQGIETLLTHRRMNDLLEKYDLQFNFYIHNNMACYLSAIHPTKKINIINSSDKTIQHLLKESSLLITDYSSVAWDFYYLGKPVLFYQFDQEEYLSREGSYIDFKSELFGEVFEECDSLIDSMDKHIINNFAELPEYTKKRNLFFKYRDTYNCNRIFKTITSSQQFPIGQETL